MPIYEYKCTKCKHNFEELQKISEADNSIPNCPKCGGFSTRELSAHVVRSFKAQFIEDVQNEPIYVRNKQEVTDAVNRFNDSELASKQGKVRVYE